MYLESEIFMIKYDYVEKTIEVSRREFLGLAGVVAAVLWTGAYAFTDIFVDRNKYIKMRISGLYQDGESKAIRQSHNNPSLQAMYKYINAKPLDPLAEELFHTKYIDRTRI